MIFVTGCAELERVQCRLDHGYMQHHEKRLLKSGHCVQAILSVLSTKHWDWEQEHNG